MNKTDRIFNVPDAELQQFSDTVAETLPQDITDFKLFDSTFPDTYPTDIKTALGAVKAIKTDMVVIDEMTEKTQAVANAMAACNTAFKTIKFFVTKSFPDNAAVHNQFGFNDIAKVRQNQAGMLVFMNDFVKIVNSHKAQLTAEGCSEALIDSLPQLLDDLQTSKTEQEMFKKKRGLITQERIEKLNELYQLLTPVSDIAQIIYADDVARMSRYMIPRPKSTSNSEDDLIA